jgi:hypothetical protein
LIVRALGIIGGVSFQRFVVASGPRCPLHLVATGMASKLCSAAGIGNRGNWFRSLWVLFHAYSGHRDPSLTQTSS